MTKAKYWPPLLALACIAGALFLSPPAYAADEFGADSQADGWQAATLISTESRGEQSESYEDTAGLAPDEADTPEVSASGVPADGPASLLRPFTPDGTGTVIDNATDGDGKEFFTVDTEDGDVFYLIIDRQRSADNVYLLNAVTVEDLMALAGKSGGNSQSAIPTQAAPKDTPEAGTGPSAQDPPADKGGTGSGTAIFIVIAVAAVGAAGYYFKILLPKKQAEGAVDDDDGYDDDDYDDDDYGDGDPAYSESAHPDYGVPGEGGDAE